MFRGIAPVANVHFSFHKIDWFWRHCTGKAMQCISTQYTAHQCCMLTCSSEMDIYVHTVSSRSVILCSFSCLSVCSLLSTTANLYCVSSSIIRSSWISFSFSRRASELVLSYEQGQNSNWQLVKNCQHMCWTHIQQTLRFVHLFVWKLQIPTTKHDRYHEMEGNATSIPVL